MKVVKCLQKKKKKSKCIDINCESILVLFFFLMNILLQ